MIMSRLKLPYQAFRSVYLCRYTEFEVLHVFSQEIADVEDDVVIIDCVAILYEEGEGGEHYRNKNKFRCWVSRIEKRLVKLKAKIW